MLSISWTGTPFPWYEHIDTLVVSQSVKQCMTVDLFPLILANVADIQKEHLLLHTPVLNKTPRLSSARMFVRLYRLLLIHCIYVSVTKPTCPAFSAWLNTGSVWSLKVTGKAIMLCSMSLPSKLFATLHSQSNIGSMCYCKPCRSLILSVLVKFYQELTVTMLQVPEGTVVSTQGQHYVK